MNDLPPRTGTDRPSFRSFRAEVRRIEITVCDALRFRKIEREKKEWGVMPPAASADFGNRAGSEQYDRQKRKIEKSPTCSVTDCFLLLLLLPAFPRN